MAEMGYSTLVRSMVFGGIGEILGIAVGTGGTDLCWKTFVWKMPLYRFPKSIEIKGMWRCIDGKRDSVIVCMLWILGI